MQENASLFYNNLLSLSPSFSKKKKNRNTIKKKKKKLNYSPSNGIWQFLKIICPPKSKKFSTPVYSKEYAMSNNQGRGQENLLCPGILVS